MVLLGVQLLAVGEVLLAFVLAHFEGIWGQDGGTLGVGAKGAVEGLGGRRNDGPNRGVAFILTSISSDTAPMKLSFSFRTRIISLRK